VINAPGARLEKLSIFNCSDSGIAIFANDVAVKNCLVVSCFNGVSATSANMLVIEKNTIRTTKSGGIACANSARCARAQERPGELRVGAGSASEARTAASRTTRSRATRSPRSMRTGAHPIVRRNKIRTSFFSTGILVVGSDAEVESNTIFDVDGAGIYCAASPALVRKNRVVSTGPDKPGVYVENGTGIILEANIVENAGSAGFEGVANDVIVRKNLVRRSGRQESTSAAYILSGIGGEFDSNVAKDCFGDGFRIGTSAAAITGNVATGNTVDGFDVDAPNCTLKGNTAKANLAEGFDIGGAGCAFTNNTAKSNRIDVAATVAPTTFQANQYGSGGSSTMPEID
jgi:parallel beta-helix repeat protein